MFNILSICFVIVFFVGLLLGYLYSRSKIKKVYKLTIKELSEKIKYQEDEMENVVYQYREIIHEVQLYKEELKEINQSIKTYQEEVQSKDSLNLEVDETHSVLREQYQEKNEILDYYENEMDEIKAECRLDNILNIDKDRERMLALVDKKEQVYSEVKDNLTHTSREFHAINLEIKTLEDEFKLLAKKVREKIGENISSQEKNEQFKTDVWKEYAVLEKKSFQHQEKTKEYQVKIDLLRASQE